MKYYFIIIFLFFIYSAEAQTNTIRHVSDTVGFVNHSWQMDSLVRRINQMYKQKTDSLLFAKDIDDKTVWKTAICPHDDYSYAGYMYPLILKNIKAKTVIIFGVCHKAGQFGLENKIVFDSFSSWMGPYGKVKVSQLRDSIIKFLPDDVFVTDNHVQSVEHSVEAIVPFLQHYNKDVEIISILVPYMNFDRMDQISEILAKAIDKVFENQSFGEDYAFVISNDAVHYGNEDWGNSNFDFLGSGETGYANAVAKEHEIISNCFNGQLSEKKINLFYNYLVDDNDLKQYKWTWCGRFSVSLGLLTAMKLQALSNQQLISYPLQYSTSIDHEHVKVNDIRMGVTAPAKINHWVGYATIGFR
ncbi:MAG: AmmeMemoRadiSam system protein B [Bacteroidota bacterium]